VKIGAITGLFSVMLVCTYSQIRINYVMASDGLLPPLFNRLSAKRRTPVANTLVCGVIIALIAAFMPLSALGTLVSMGTLLAFTIVCVGVIYLRRAQPELKRPFRCPGVDTVIPFTTIRFPWVPLGGVASCVYVISGLPFKTLEHFSVWLSAGMAVYFLYGYTRSKVYTPARDFAARKPLGLMCLLLVIAYPFYLSAVAAPQAPTIAQPAPTEAAQ
jgi:basic amino acid/polyamine antiporter, APA family